MTSAQSILVVPILAVVVTVLTLHLMTTLRRAQAAERRETQLHEDVASAHRQIRDVLDSNERLLKDVATSHRMVKEVMAVNERLLKVIGSYETLLKELKRAL